MSPAGALTHRQVRWRIVFSKEGQEVSFPYRMALLAGDVKEQDFRDQTCAQWLSELDRIERPQVWIDQDYPPGVEGDYIEALPSADIGYVNLDLDVLSYDPANDGGGSFVRLPGSGVVAGPLDCNLSEFGDEFYGLPSDFGKRPPPGRTYLSGWIEFTFDKPVGHDVRFVIHYLGLGNEVTNTWGGGQLFEHHRLKCFPMTFLPDLKTQIFNEGKLDLRTGVVDAASVRVYSIFQGSIIAGTDRRNRIGHAFPYMYPMVPPVPPPGQRPPGWEAPPEDLNTFASVRFHYDWSGSITGAELHSKTIALVGLFPIVNRLGTPEQKLFPPFSFGRNMAFYFANPTRCLAGTPPGSRYDTSAAPNGTPTAMSVFFRPHIHLHSDHVRETPSKPQSIPCVPHAIARCTSVVTADCLFLIGGLDDSGVSARVQIFDPATDKWTVGPPLPLPVFGAQGDAIGTRIYVTGGWTGALNERRIVDEMQILDTATGVWSRGPKMPCALAEGTACAVRDRLYVISGWDKDGQISRVVSAFEPSTGKWARVADACLPAVAASAVVVKNRIFVVGGRYAANEVSTRTTIYDTVHNEWSVGPDLEMAVMAGVAGHVEDRIYLVGGREAVGGPALRSVQELDFGEKRWRLSLPQPLPTAGSGGGVVGNTLYIAGGRVMTGNDALPGDLTDLTQTFTTVSDWTLSESRPIFTSTGVLNAAALVAGARSLSPGCRAIVVGDRFVAPGSSAEQAIADIKITVGGKSARILKVQPDRIDFLTPDDIPLNTSKVEFTVRRMSSARQAPPVRISVADAAPGLFTFTFGETQEPAFLEFGAALAANQDNTLNFADQPAKPGSHLMLYATGLGKSPNAALVDVRMGAAQARSARVLGIRPVNGYPGVFEVEIIVPDDIGISNNVPIVLEAGGVDSNQAVVAIAAEQTRLSEPVAKEVGLSFVFGPPGRSLVPFRPESEELDVDMRSDTAYWRHFRSLEP